MVEGACELPNVRRSRERRRPPPLAPIRMASVARTTVIDGRHPLIVHSHLRWDFVWQRPQQILSRFGRSRPVLYVEEPVFADDLSGGSLDVSQPAPGVYRVVPRL